MAQIKTLDITPAQVRMPVIEISQYDVGRPIIVHMKDGNDWYDLTGLTVRMQGTKPSGFGYSVTGTVDGHDVTFVTDYDMSSESGFIASEVSIIDGTDVIGSQNVMLHVEQSPHPPEIVDGSPETILPEMRELVNRAEAAAEILLDCSATATTLPTGSSATASYDVDNGVFTFGIPRGAKGDTGATGETGNGISSITKAGTSGLVDTYTITYTNGNTTTFTVTNGQNGTGSVSDVWQNNASVLDGNIAKVTVPTKTSDLTNDSGFVTSVPTKTSDLTNDSDFVSDSSYVHTDNNYTTTEKDKLSGIATGAEANVQSDWNETDSTADAYIANKPSIGDLTTLATADQSSIVNSINEIAYNVISDGAGAHNAIYRGKNLGTSVTAAQWAAIAAGTFHDLFIGDYWVINSVTWRIAAFNYWLNYGDTACTTNHVVIVPDSNLTSGKMNDTNITTGAYIGSDFYTGNNSNTAFATVKTAVNNAFGAAHILNHREHLQNAVTNGYESGGSWYDSTVELMTERMVYGCDIFHNTMKGTNIPNAYSIDCGQLPLFRFDRSRICNRGSWWLRGVVSSAAFAVVYGYGNCNYNAASNSLGVRPAFGICA